MIDDPIVIRKSKGNYIVSSSIPTDPIQLVRQLSPTELEVHLKNGHRYIEEVNEDDIQDTILEMMGYKTHLLGLSFHTWPEKQSGTLHFEDGEVLDRMASSFIQGLFTNTPYLSSKFISASIEVFENADIKYYDYTYSSYDVNVDIEFRCRVDHKGIIAEVAEESLRDLWKMFTCGRSLANNFEATVFSTEEYK